MISEQMFACVQRPAERVRETADMNIVLFEGIQMENAIWYGKREIMDMRRQWDACLACHNEKRRKKRQQSNRKKRKKTTTTTTSNIVHTVRRKYIIILSNLSTPCQIHISYGMDMEKFIVLLIAHSSIRTDINVFVYSYIS